MMYKEVKGNLFSAPKDTLLVHCISRDAKMGAGIAKTFRQKYPDMPAYVRQSRPTVPSSVIYLAPDSQAIMT